MSRAVGGSRSVRGLTAGPCCPLLGGLGSAATSLGPTSPASGCGQVRAWPGMGVICPHCWPEATGGMGEGAVSGFQSTLKTSSPAPH